MTCDAALLAAIAEVALRWRYPGAAEGHGLTQQMEDGRVILELLEGGGYDTRRGAYAARTTPGAPVPLDGRTNGPALVPGARTVLPTRIAGPLPLRVMDKP